MSCEFCFRIGRSPSLLTIGSVRVRFISHKDSVLPSGENNSGNEETCCCSSSLPQISIANANNRNSLVYRSSLQWKHYSCFGSEEKNGVNFTQGSLSPPAKPRAIDSFPYHTTSLRENNLDRFSNLRFGGDNSGRGGKRAGNKKKNRSSDKTERLKQLTAKLTSPSTSQQEQNKEAAVNTTTTESVTKEDDIFNLTFAKPESRTIVGAYTQRSIPFRSASFSQVDVLPEGKYVRQSNVIRSMPQPPGSSTLPRKKILEPIIHKRDVNSVDRELPKNTSETFSGPKFSARALTHPLGKPLSLSNTNIPYNTDDSALRSLSYQRIPESQLEEDIELYHPPHASSLPPSPFPPPQPPKRNKHIKLVKEAANSSKEESQSAEESLNIIKECCTQLSNFDQPSSIPSKNGNYNSTWFSVNEEETKPELALTEIKEDTKLENNNADPILDSGSSSEIVAQTPSCGEPKVESTDPQQKESNSSENTTDESTKAVESDETLPSPGTPGSSDLLIEPLFPDPVKQEPSSETITVSKPKSESPSFPVTPRYTRSSSTPKSLERSLDKVKLESQHEGGEGRHSPRRFYIFSRADSLSEGDSDQGEKNREGTASPSSMTPGDCSDYENRMNKITSRRFSKKPLRGPLLEAEMKKMDGHKKLGKIHSEDFHFLDDIGPMRHRTLDECHLKRTYSAAAATTLPKRKNSIGIPYSLSVTSTPGGIHHQRTTSSPSQLEGCAESNAKLFEQLMKGSSERLLVPQESLVCKYINSQKGMMVSCSRFSNIPRYVLSDSNCHILCNLISPVSSFYHQLS